MLIDNFIPYLFYRIEGGNHNKLIDEIEFPDIINKYYKYYDMFSSRSCSSN